MHILDFVCQETAVIEMADVIKEKKEPSEKQNINQFISMTLYRYIFVPTDEK